LPIFQAGNSVVIAGSEHMTDTESKLYPRELLRTAMRLVKLSVPALVAAAMVAVAAAAHADPDTDFANQLHRQGIYGPLDYNAWLGKITCERLHNGVDTTAGKSAHFALVNLPRSTTAGQSYQFLAAAISTYCPDQVPLLTSAAARHQ
jgi:hypothetical protein